MPHMATTVQPYLGTERPYIDLTLQPYNVVADNTALAVRQQNTRGINAAIAAHSGSNAVLKLPLGVVHFEESASNFCIKFGTGVTDLTLEGCGQYATTIAMHAVADGGDLHLLVLDGCQRIEICNLGMYQDTITNVEVTQQNHMLCIFNNTQGGTTRDIRVHHVYFGKCVGDAIRILADDPADKVQNVEVSHFVMQLAGTVTSTPGNGRVGARCGIAIQRGGEDITFVDGYIRGAQASCIDEEPSSGSSSRVRYIRVHCDGTQSLSDATCTLGGSGDGFIAYDGLMQDCYVTGGDVQMLGGTSGFKFVRTVIEQIVASQVPANPLLQLRSQAGGHENFEMIDCTLIRKGTAAAGKCVDIINTGNTKIRGLTIVQATAADPMWIESNASVEVTNYKLLYSGTGPGSRKALVVQPQEGSGKVVDEVYVNNVAIESTTGALGYAVYLASRADRTIDRVKIRDIRADGHASIGVGINATASTMDVNPEISGVDVGSGTVLETLDNSDSPVTTYFPIIAGSRNAVAIYHGTGAPTFSANTGSQYSRIDGGASTSLYINTSAGGSGTTWTAK